jgi:dipeptidyl aminopeptidase/acylaminoacyl peptidase
MASRDSTLNAVACAAAPTDFLTKKAYYKYGVQYTYQFLSRNKPLSQIRRHIIKSSPCYFIDSFQNDLLLIHGRYDQTVDVEHAEKVIAKLKSHKNFESEIQDIGHYFKNMNKIAIWLREKN